MRADVTDELPLPAVGGLGQRVVVGTATLPEGTVLLLVLRLDVWSGTRRRRVDVQLTAALDIVTVLDPTPWSHAGEAWAAAAGDWFLYVPYTPDELHGAVVDWHEDPADIVTLLRDRDHDELARELEAEVHGTLAVEEIVHVGSDGVHDVVIALRDIDPRLDPDFGGRGRFVQRRFSLKVCPGCDAPDEHIGRHIVGRTPDEIRAKVTALLDELDGTPRRLWDDELRARFDVVAHDRWSTLGWYGPGTGVVLGAWLRRRPWRRRRAWVSSDPRTRVSTAVVKQVPRGRVRRREPAERWRDGWASGRVCDGNFVRIGEDLWLAVGMSGAVAGWAIVRETHPSRADGGA